MENNKYSLVRILYEKTIATMTAIGSIWTILLIVVILIDVIGRLFDQPLIGTSEIIRNSIVGITFLQLAHVLKMDRHIRTTVVCDRVSLPIKKGLLVLAYLLGSILCVLLLCSEWNPTWEALRNGDYEGEGALKIPTFPFHFLILLGTFFLLIQFLICIYDTLFRSENIGQFTQEEI